MNLFVVKYSLQYVIILFITASASISQETEQENLYCTCHLMCSPLCHPISINLMSVKETWFLHICVNQGECNDYGHSAIKR